MTDRSPSPPQLWALVKPCDISAVKKALQHQNILNRSLKIITNAAEVKHDFDLPAALLNGLTNHGNLCAIPTTLVAASESRIRDSNILGEDENLPTEIIAFVTRRSDAAEAAPASRAVAPEDKLTAATRQWLQRLPSDTRAKLPHQWQSIWPRPGYRIYGKLLILAADVFDREPWAFLVCGSVKDFAEDLYANICLKLNATHIVANAPIPLKTARNGEVGENVLRAPASLQLVYGDFPPFEEPNETAFARALWVTARQNGIQQVFAPMYTMFSNGNINEKKRIMTHEIFVKAAREQSCSAVDLYAGIGYFAFSYAKAGYGKVLCWEISEWSVEGLRRGSQLNAWDTTVFRRDDATGLASSEHDASTSKFLVFKESNERALSRIEQVRNKIPPVVHVNCGYLPSSQSCWASAIRILDQKLGGWIHAHENCAQEDISKRARQVEEYFQAELKVVDTGPKPRTAKCENVEKVKSYAPGVIHCVFDVRVYRPDQP